MTNDTAERHNWYVVKTAPGAQQPQREYAVEKSQTENPRGKGYRIVPSLNPRKSAIERALEERGFVCYMPAEKRLIRDRRHTDLWKARRFALMVGYVFVLNPEDFGKLEAVPGVSGVLRDRDSNPMRVSLSDIMLIRSAEAEAEATFDEQSRRARQDARRRAKKDPRLEKLIKKFDLAGEYSLPWEKAGIAA